MKNSPLFLLLFLFLTSCGGDGVPSNGTPSPAGPSGNNNQTTSNPPECLITHLVHSKLVFNDKIDFFEQIRGISKNCEDEETIEIFFREKLIKDKNYLIDIEKIFNLKGEQ